MHHARVQLDAVDRANSDQTVYLVVDDLGRKLGRIWREAGVEHTDLETVIQDLLTVAGGQSALLSTAITSKERISLRRGGSNGRSADLVGVAQELLQLRVLFLKRLQPLGLGHVHPAILGLPIVQRGLGGG